MVRRHPSRIGDGKIGLINTALFCAAVGPLCLDLLATKFSSDSGAKKKALALAVSWGMLGFLLFSAVFSLMISSVGFSSNEWEAEAVFGGLALLQLSLIAASIKAYLSMQPEPGDGRILL